MVVIGLGIGLSINASAEENLIPSWIKNTAGWWASGSIGDTESEVLGIGISLIILNAMMYVGLPVFGIMMLRKSNNTL